jgi:hypothetical protein
MGTDGARGLLFCAAKQSGAFPPDMPAGLRARVSRLHCGKLTLAAIYLLRVRVVGRTFAPGVPSMTHVSTALRLRQKASTWASSGPAGGRRVPAC